MSLSKEEREQALKLSKKLADEFDADRAARFSQGHRDKEWYDDFITLFEMITDTDFAMSAATWATIAGALAYVVFPVDIIPDFILYIGWLDDVFILGWAMKVLAGEIALYREFCLSRQIIHPGMVTS